MHHVTDAPFLGLPSKHLVFFFLAAALVILGAQLAVRSYGDGGVPRGMGAAVEGLVLFVRDQIAEPSIGHGDGRKFTPLPAASSSSSSSRPSSASCRSPPRRPATSR
jgi:F-type H+-transporting ATPase subunit a